MSEDDLTVAQRGIGDAHVPVLVVIVSILRQVIALQAKWYLVNHVTFGVPVFNGVFLVNLDVLFEDSHLTACAADGKLSGVVEVTEDSAVVLVIGILGSKDGGTGRASEMVGMVLFVKCNDVRTA